MAQRRSVHDGPAGDDGALGNAPVPPARHKREEHGSEDVRKAGIQRPHDTGASRQRALAVLSGSRAVDLARQRRERPLERGGIHACLVTCKHKVTSGAGVLPMKQTFPNGQKETMTAREVQCGPPCGWERRALKASKACSGGETEGRHILSAATSELPADGPVQGPLRHGMVT